MDTNEPLQRQTTGLSESETSQSCSSMQPPTSWPSDKIEKSLTNEGTLGHGIELCESCTCPKHGAQAHLAVSGHFRNVGSPLAILERNGRSDDHVVRDAVRHRRRWRSRVRAETSKPDASREGGRTAGPVDDRLTAIYAFRRLLPFDPRGLLLTSRM